MDEPCHSSHAMQRSHHQNQTKWHQDRGLKKVGDDHGPEPAQYAVEDDDGARSKNGPSHAKAAGRGHKQTKPVERAGACKQLKQDSRPGESLMGEWIESPGEIFHHGGDAAPAPTLGKNKVSEQKT